MSLTKAEKIDIITKHGKNKEDTGSCEVQISLLTADIKKITEHLKDAPKDYSTKRGLYKMSSQRKALLNYLKRVDINRYRDIVKKLDIRG